MTALAAAAGAGVVRPLFAAPQTPPPPAASASAPVVAADTVLAFQGVTVIDVATGQRLAGQTVVVVGPRIQAVGPVGQVAVPAGARVVEAGGKYLLPGFWDMHVHITGNIYPDDSIPSPYLSFIANGVTGIREMAQMFDGGSAAFRTWQREIMAGRRIGPRGVGPSADLSQGNNLSIDTPADAVRVIDSLKAAGDAFAKYHGRIAGDFGDRERFFALAREARRVGLPIVGHLPYGLTEVEAADSGLRSVEHVFAFKDYSICWPGGLPKDSVAAALQCGPVAQAYVRNGTWFTPTLAVRRSWKGSTDPVYHRGLWFVRMLRRYGLTRFLAGSDWVPDFFRDDPHFKPGLSGVEEMILLAQAGLTPLEALQAGTLNPARFFEATDSLGTVAPGKLADLVLLDGDPLSDIRNVLQLRVVVANGRYFDRAALDRLDRYGPHGLLEDGPARADSGNENATP